MNESMYPYSNYHEIDTRHIHTADGSLLAGMIRILGTRG